MYHCIRSSGAYYKLTTFYSSHRMWCSHHQPHFWDFIERGNYTPIPSEIPVYSIFILTLEIFAFDRIPLALFEVTFHGISVYFLEPRPNAILVMFSLCELTTFKYTSTMLHTYMYVECCDYVMIIIIHFAFDYPSSWQSSQYGSATFWISG